MFTGIVEEIGTLTAVYDQGDAVRLTVRGPLVVSDARAGDSIAVDGCCLTVTDLEAESFGVDVMKESLDRTSLGGRRVGDPVNLERALGVDGRLGGHVVQGHVDGTGTLVRRVPSEHWEIFAFTTSAELMRYVAAKGSIAVDGTSLTVVEVDDGPEPSFTVSLIPTTLRSTTLGDRQVGDVCNLEVDVLAKYVERLMA